MKIFRLCTAGLTRAISATTSCAKSSRFTERAHDDADLPDAVLSIVGELAAFDHWRLSGSRWWPTPTSRPGASDADLDEVYDAAVDLACASWPAHAPTCCLMNRWSSRRRPPSSGPRILEVQSSTLGAELYCQAAVEVAKEHILAGDIFQVVLAQRSTTSTPTVRRLPRAAPGEPEPVHVPAPHPG